MSFLRREGFTVLPFSVGWTFLKTVLRWGVYCFTSFFHPSIIKSNLRRGVYCFILSICLSVFIYKSLMRRGVYCFIPVCLSVFKSLLRRGVYCFTPVCLSVRLYVIQTVFQYTAFSFLPLTPSCIHPEFFVLNLSV